MYLLILEQFILFQFYLTDDCRKKKLIANKFVLTRCVKYNVYL